MVALEATKCTMHYDNRTMEVIRLDKGKLTTKSPLKLVAVSDLILADRLMAGKNIPSMLKSRKNPLTVMPLTVNDI